jgi:hypothetical protein
MSEREKNIPRPYRQRPSFLTGGVCRVVAHGFRNERCRGVPEEEIRTVAKRACGGKLK